MIRTFIAVQFPDQVKQQVAQAISPLKANLGERSVRWVETSLFHLTLKFLGDIEDGQMDEIRRVVERVASANDRLSVAIGALGVFPESGKPRVLYIGLYEPSGKLHKIKQSLESEFKPLGFKADGRKFHPHITIGRVRRGVTRHESDQIKQSIAVHRVGQLGESTVDSIDLIRSDLTPSGPIYSEIGKFGLGI